MSRAGPADRGRGPLAPLGGFFPKRRPGQPPPCTPPAPPRACLQPTGLRGLRGSCTCRLLPVSSRSAPAPCAVCPPSRPSRALAQRCGARAHLQTRAGPPTRGWSAASGGCSPPPSAPRTRRGAGPRGPGPGPGTWLSGRWVCPRPWPCRRRLRETGRGRVRRGVALAAGAGRGGLRVCRAPRAAGRPGGPRWSTGLWGAAGPDSDAAGPRRAGLALCRPRF